MIEKIQQAVADYYDIPVAALKSKSKDRKFVTPRHIAMYFCKVLTDDSLKKIGQYFGNRDHSTVIHGIRNVEDWKEAYGKEKKKIDQIERLISMALEEDIELKEFLKIQDKLTNNYNWEL
jgi:chromosomal replication initiator protein